MSELDKTEERRFRFLPWAYLLFIALLSTSSAAPAQQEMDSDVLPLLQELQDEDAGVRQNAASALEQFAKDKGIKLALPALIEAMADRDDGVRLHAAAVLRAMGPGGEDAVPALSRLLKDELSSVRLVAAEAIGAIGAGALDSVGALVQALDDDDGSVRIAIAFSLQALAKHDGDRVARILVETMDDPDQSDRIRRIASGLISETHRFRNVDFEDFAPEFGRALRDRDGMIRRLAIRVVENESGLAREIVPQLIESLADVDVAAKLVDILSRISDSALPELILALGNERDAIRRYAAKVLSQRELKERTAIESLKTTLAAEPDVATRRFAALALGQARSMAKEVVPSLVDALETDPSGVVQRSSAIALKNIGEPAAAAIPALEAALRKPDTLLQRYAAEALGALGLKAKVASRALERAMQSPSPAVKRAAATSLVQIGLEAQAVTKLLVDALEHDEDAGLRRVAAESLGKLKETAAGSTLALARALRDPEVSVRIAAAVSLGAIGAAAEPAIPALEEALSDDGGGLASADDDEAAARLVLESLPNFRQQVLTSLGQIGAPAVPALVKAMEHPDETIRQRAVDGLVRAVQVSNVAAPEAVQALAAAIASQDNNLSQASLNGLLRLGKRATAAAPTLLELLETADRRLKPNLIRVVANLGSEGRKSIPALTRFLAEGDRGERNFAIDTLGKIAEDLYLNTPADLKLSGIDTTLDDLKSARAELDKFEDLKDRPAAKKIEQAITSLEDELWTRVQDETVALAKAYPALTIGVPLYIAWVLLWLMALWVAPRSILRVNNLLRPLEAELPGRFGRVRLPLRYLLFVGFLNYQPRVLDAWIAGYIDSVRERFPRKRTVADREVHIPVPVALDRKTVSNLTRDHIGSIFGRGLGCLLIWGEGGSGKTSLACQIARWAMAEDPQDRICDHIMLPVLVEQELNINVPEGRDPLTEAIAKQIQDLTEQEVPIRDDLLRQLLRQRRILVIVDHLSEMGEATRAKVSPELSDFPVNAMIVTSRLEEELGGITKTVLRPLRITGNRLSSFMEAYLTERGEREDFADAEFFDACRRLSAMVRDRDITLLLAKLYAEQMISAKNSDAESDLPATIPDLMLSYLNELNYGVSEGKIEDREVHHAAKVLAWECVRQTFRPAPAKYEDVIAALDLEDAKDRIDYLETRLRLCRSVQPAQDEVNILLDPLAEYLAGLYLVDIYGDRETAWRDFLSEADTKFGAPWAIRGFLLAVRDCVLARSAGVEIPAFVESELRKRAVVSTPSAPTLASAA